MSIAATDFQRAFLESYASFRATYVEIRDWHLLWEDTALWSDRMLYSENSVIQNTAKALALRVHPGEPLRIDAALSPQCSTSWFPIHVAIEHENAPLTVKNEIRALASIRAPLKVIITYALCDYRRPDQIVRDLPGKIAAELLTINSLLCESVSTQYLFLVGRERPEREIQWWSMAFTSGESLEGKEFSPSNISN